MAILLIPVFFGCASIPPLMQAAYDGDVNRTKNLLDEGSDVNLKGGGWNETALIIAATKGHMELVQYLLDNGADVNLLSGSGDSALLGATWQCHPDIAMLLMSNGADINFLNPSTGSSPLLHAVQCDDLSLAKTLIEKGANVNRQSQNSSSPLVEAAWHNNVQLAEVLVDAGADIDALWPGGGSALYEAAAKGHEPVVEFLIGKGADVNLTSNHYGWSALLAAAMENHFNTANMLIDAGADLEVKDQGGFNALLYAAINGNALIVKKLCESGANVNVQDNRGWTPLQQAISYEYESIVAILMMHNADVRITNKEGRDARWYAAKSRNKNIIEMINDPDPELLAAFTTKIEPADSAFYGNRIEDATIENVRKAKPLNVSYRDIVFNRFEISKTLKQRYPEAATNCKQSIINHLRKVSAFDHVSDAPASSYPEKTCLVDGLIEDMYVSSRATRLFFGPISKIPFMKVRIKLTDAETKTVFHEMVISSDTDIYWTRVTVGNIDAFIPEEVGKIIGEYINTILPSKS